MFPLATQIFVTRGSSRVTRLPPDAPRHGPAHILFPLISQTINAGAVTKVGHRCGTRADPKVRKVCIVALSLVKPMSRLRFFPLGSSIHCVARYKITHMSVVPSIVHQLAVSPKTEEADMGSIVSISSGASYLPDSLTRRLARLAPKNTILSEGMR